MPCKKYKSKKQRKLCFLTKGWKDFSKVKRLSKKEAREYNDEYWSSW